MKSESFCESLMTERRYAAVGSDDGDGAGGDSDAAADDFAVGAGAAADADADAPAAVPVPAPSPSSCVGTPLCILVITCRRTSSIFVSDLRRIRFSRLSISFLNCFGGIMRQPPIGAILLHVWPRSPRCRARGTARPAWSLVRSCKEAAYSLYALLALVLVPVTMVSVGVAEGAVLGRRWLSCVASPTQAV